MPDRYTIAVEMTATDKTGNALGTIKRGFNEAFNEVVTGAYRRAGESAMDFVKQLPAMAIDLAKLGVSAESAENRFTKFAGGAGRATMFLDAFNEGTDRTVDRMTAMSSAGRLLQMGLVDTGDEMSQIAAMATKLGNQTMGAGERIADFAALLANQSIPRLDNFGISSGRVRQRIDELLKSGQALNREQAFKMAVMAEGAKALDTLGDTSDTAATKMEKLQAALQDTKLGFAEMALGAINAAGATGGSVDDLADRIRGLPTTVKQVSAIGKGIDAAVSPLRDFLDVANALLNPLSLATDEMAEMGKAGQGLAKELGLWQWFARVILGSERFAEGVRDGAAALELLNVSQADAQQGMSFTTGLIDQETDTIEYNTDKRAEMLAEMYRVQRIQEDLAGSTIPPVVRGLEEEAEALEDVAKASMDVAEANLNQAMRYADFEENKTKTAEGFAEKREEIERTHQEKLADLAKRGQSWRKKVDEDGLRLEVRIAQGRLAQLLERQSDFSEDTTDLERAQTERSIRNLQGEIAEKTGLLERAHDGYVAMKGQNVDALIAEENRQYSESLAALEESQAEQEESQRQSLGRMVLQHFNAWAEMNLAADGYTKEEAEFVSKMRMQISHEYGLITDAAIVEMSEQEAKWASMIGNMEATALTFFDVFMRKFNALPSEKVIRIRTELATPRTEGPGGGETMQHGSAFARGGWALVGERGPEMAFIPRGAAVYPTDQSRHMTTHNYNLTVNSQTPSAGVANEFYLMESLAR